MQAEAEVAQRLRDVGRIESCEGQAGEERFQSFLVDKLFYACFDRFAASRSAASASEAAPRDFFDDELVVEQRADLFDALRSAVPTDGRPFLNVLREEVEQPLGFDARCHADEGQGIFFAVFGVDGEHEFVGGYFAGYLGREACREQHLISRAATGYAVRKSGEQGKQQSIVVMACLPGRSSEAEKLIGVLAKALIGRQVHCGEQIVLLASRAEAEHGGYAASVFSYASVEGFDEDARQAWRQRKTRESLRHASGCADAVEE